VTAFVEIEIGEFFEGQNGHPRFIKDYLDRHPGKFPVYSASLEAPFGHVDTFDYEGHHLTWVMNGYGGRVQEVSGRFSANRDRGVLVPHPGTRLPNLTYLRFAMEPVLVAAAVGRRMEGGRNDYTKIYPDAAMVQRIQVPIDKVGRHDYAAMEMLGVRLRRIEAAKAEVRRALEDVLATQVTIESLVRAGTYEAPTPALKAVAKGVAALKKAESLLGGVVMAKLE